MFLKKLMKILVNLITTSRLICSLLLIVLNEKISDQLFILIIAMLFFSDFLDGMLARKFEVQTFYGSMMDTVADKVLSIVLIIPLLNYGNWVGFILIGELGIALLNIWGRIQGKHTRASMVGKIKMWLLAITILLGYCCHFGWIQLWSFMISGIVTIGVQGYLIGEYYFYIKRQKRNMSSKASNNNSFNIMYLLFSTDYYKKNILVLDKKNR